MQTKAELKEAWKQLSPDFQEAVKSLCSSGGFAGSRVVAISTSKEREQKESGE